MPGPATVYLVGAGPGDPGLLTVRGAELLAQADVVVHDRLSNPALLALAPASAERVDVGKQPDDRDEQGSIQDGINQALIERALAGRRVVRLKGGDPFVFGRGGEEALALTAAGVPYEVVPGVTSAIAAPAYAGVPVTHRGLVTSFTVVAGHSRSVEGPAEAGGTNWEALAAAGGTIVVLMGAAHRARIAERLMSGGLPAHTPVAAVQWGTEPRQTTLRTTLERLGQADLKPPVTIVIGTVAGLDLAWYESRPLLGRRVVVTRAAHQAADLSLRLRRLGADVVEVPTISVEGPADGGTALRSSVGLVTAGVFEWVAFTSANAVHRFFALVPDSRMLGRVRVAAVGPATAAALKGFHITADLVPSAHTAEALAQAFPSPGRGTAFPPPGGEARPRPGVLLPQAANASEVLAAGLRAKGWTVEATEAYRTVPVALSEELLGQVSTADAICFASPSALESLIGQSGPARVPPVVVCLGPATAARARAMGLAVSAEAPVQTLDSLVEAVVGALAGPRARNGDQVRTDETAR